MFFPLAFQENFLHLRTPLSLPKCPRQKKSYLSIVNSQNRTYICSRFAKIASVAQLVRAADC